MLNCFGDLIGWTVEAYVDDIVVKSKRADHLVANLEQTFAKLWANGIKLNPKKPLLHRLRARHRSQPGENLSHHKDGPDPEHKGGLADHGVRCHPQLIHLTPRRTRSPPLPPFEKSRPLQVDARGPGGT